MTTMRSPAFAHAGPMLLVLALSTLQAATASRDPHHYVFFGHDRERIVERSFLDNPVFEGAQIRYSWRQLEHGEDGYDFADIQHDLDFLMAHGKRLFVQIQDISYSATIVPLPKYLIEKPAYRGGAARQFRVSGDDETHATP